MISPLAVVCFGGVVPLVLLWPTRPSRGAAVEVGQQSPGIGRAFGFWHRRRLVRRRVEALPIMLELVSRDLRGGATLLAAFERLARSDTPLAPSVAAMVARVHRGDRLTVALDTWAHELEHADAGLVRAVLGLGHVTGAAMAEALDRAALTLRGRRELEAEVRALTSQTRASAMLISVAPVAFLGFLSLIDPSTVAFLVTSPLGWLCLILGSVLDLIGLAWMVRMSRSVAR